MAGLPGKGGSNPNGGSAIGYTRKALSWRADERNRGVGRQRLGAQIALVGVAAVLEQEVELGYRFDAFGQYGQAGAPPRRDDIAADHRVVLIG